MPKEYVNLTPETRTELKKKLHRIQNKCALELKILESSLSRYLSDARKGREWKMPLKIYTGILNFINNNH